MDGKEMRFKMKKIKKEYYFIAILFILFILLTIFVVVGNASLIDENFYNGIIKLKNNTLTNILYVITNLASTIGIISLVILTSIVFIRRKKVSSLKYVILNVLSGVFLMQVLKNIIRRIRPSWKWIKQGGFSYPSGHTISALLLYGTIILLVSKKYNGKYKKQIIILSSAMIILTGISRIYFGAHYLSDVIASTLLGTIILIISGLLMDKESKDNDKDKIKKSI